MNEKRILEYEKTPLTFKRSGASNYTNNYFRKVYHEGKGYAMKKEDWKLAALLFLFCLLFLGMIAYWIAFGY